MNQTLAKLSVGSTTLQFQVTPLQYSIEKNYSYSIEPCLSQTHPIVSFENGSVRSLTFSIILDEDLDEKVNVTDIEKFLKAVNKVNEETRSLEEVELNLGPLKFKGFITQYRYTPMRFKPNMTPTSIRLDFAMISSEEND